MMSGVGHTLRFTPASADAVHAQACPRYPPPCVPPLELEIRYERVPVDHSWGTPADRALMPPPQEQSQPAATASAPPSFTEFGLLLDLRNHPQEDAAITGPAFVLFDDGSGFGGRTGPVRFKRSLKNCIAFSRLDDAN